MKLDSRPIIHVDASLSLNHREIEMLNTMCSYGMAVTTIGVLLKQVQYLAVSKIRLVIDMAQTVVRTFSHLSHERHAAQVILTLTANAETGVGFERSAIVRVEPARGLNQPDHRFLDGVVDLAGDVKLVRNALQRDHLGKLHVVEDKLVAVQRWFGFSAHVRLPEVKCVCTKGGGAVRYLILAAIAALMPVGCGTRAPVANTSTTESAQQPTPPTKDPRIEYKNAAILSCYRNRIDVRGQDGVFKVFEFSFGGNLDCSTWETAARWDLELKRVVKYGELSGEWRVMWAKPSAIVK
jgi:hypothetical protein